MSQNCLNQSGFAFDEDDVRARADFSRVSKMLRSIQEPRHPVTEYVEPAAYTRLRLSVSPLPLASDPANIHGLRYSTPFDESNFEKVFGKLHGSKGEELAWPQPERRWDGPRVVDHWMGLVNEALRQKFYPGEQFPPEHDSYAVKLVCARPRLIENSVWRPANIGFWHTGSVVVENIGGSNWHTEGVFTAAREPSYVDPDDELPDPDYPYLDQRPDVSCILGYEGSMDDRVPRSELICILRMLKRRLGCRMWRAHAIIPVFVFAFTDKEARITQAHYDGHTLHLRRTDPISLFHEPLSKIKLLLRWIMSEPIGDTSKRDPAQFVKISAEHKTEVPSAPCKTLSRECYQLAAPPDVRLGL